jgi:amino acid transporter
LSKVLLKRDIGFVLLTLYGLGTILGAGIYVLIGEVAQSAGQAAPSAFIISAFMAGVTAFSYAELTSRLPQSAGEAAYVAEGFGRPYLARAVGWAVILTGVVSAATMTRGFVGYLDLFISVPPPLVISGLVLIVASLAAWGISESLVLAAIVTVLEVAGLLLVCVVAGDSLSMVPENWSLLLPRAETVSLLGVLSGAFIAFYAFIGFEDMVNVAEEVKNPRTTVPRAIITALLVSTLLYVIVATIAVLSIPTQSLAESGAPLALVVESRGVSPRAIGLISLFAVINGALVQLIMASRVLYGLASKGLAMRVFARVNARTRTPLHSTALVAVVVLALALIFPLSELARFTSFIALAVFVSVNASLWRLKLRVGPRPQFQVPLAIPITGSLLCGGMMIYQFVLWVN